MLIQYLFMDTVHNLCHIGESDRRDVVVQTFSTDAIYLQTVAHAHFYLN